jgi:ABC-2 type transport system permease protein
MTSLSKYYQIDRVNMNQALNALDEYAVVVIAKPQAYFTEKDKFIIDQYIMQGGKVIWLVEWMHFSMDSLSSKPFEMAMINDINLDDQLFKYGVRINPDLIQDLRCLNIPVYVNTIDGQPQFEPKPWYFFPVIIPDTLLDHQLLRNLEPMRTHFVSSIDTVGQDPKIKKTILLRTSQYAKSLVHPVEVNLEIIRDEPEMPTFNKPFMPIAVLLEGEFTSNYVNRLSPELDGNQEFVFVPQSVPTKMIVISDGDFIRNEVKVMGDNKQPYPLGYDKYFTEQFTPGNTQFILNCVNYLCADEDLISLRMREIKVRTLNTNKLKQKMLMWVYVNSFIPVLIILVIGLLVVIFRRFKYDRKFLNYKLK